jgi:rRNA maturation endonuclease Nob1
MRAHEVYTLDCWSCGRAVEVPAGKPGQPEEQACPQCGARLKLHWRGVNDAGNQERSAAQEQRGEHGRA